MFTTFERIFLLIMALIIYTVIIFATVLLFFCAFLKLKFSIDYLYYSIFSIPSFVIVIGIIALALLILAYSEQKWFKNHSMGWKFHFFMMYSYNYYLFKVNNYNLTCTRYGIVRPLSLKFDIISSLGLLFLNMLHAAFKSAFITLPLLAWYKPLYILFPK